MCFCDEPNKSGIPPDELVLSGHPASSQSASLDGLYAFDSQPDEENLRRWNLRLPLYRRRDRPSLAIRWSHDDFAWILADGASSWRSLMVRGRTQQRFGAAGKCAMVMRISGRQQCGAVCPVPRKVGPFPRTSVVVAVASWQWHPASPPSSARSLRCLTLGTRGPSQSFRAQMSWDRNRIWRPCSRRCAGDVIFSMRSLVEIWSRPYFCERVRHAVGAGMAFCCPKGTRLGSLAQRCWLRRADGCPLIESQGQVSAQ